NGEDRNKGDEDNHHREEDRPAHRAAGTDDDRAGVPGYLVVPEVLFQVVGGVFDHDDRLVHENADGDGDARQRHDVGLHVHEVQPPQEPHQEKREEDGQRQGDADDENAAEMHEDKKNGDAGDEDLVKQHLLEVG